MKKQSKHTIGIDLGDRQHEVCVIDHEGEIAETRSIGSDRDALRSLAKKYPQVRVIICKRRLKTGTAKGAE